jgi:hypothetical protein
MSEPNSPKENGRPPQAEVGYKRPPKHTQFAKGRSGNPNGRPKRPEGISIKELLDGEQQGRNGEVISKREALLIQQLNDAAAGNQRAFGRFISLMKRADMFRKEPPREGGRIIFFETPRPSPEKVRAWRIRNGLDPDKEYK